MIIDIIISYLFSHVFLWLSVDISTPPASPIWLSDDKIWIVDRLKLSPFAFFFSSRSGLSIFSLAFVIWLSDTSSEFSVDLSFYSVTFI